MNQKKVAVLIPTYRPDTYLDRCLEALEQQTLDKSEYTVYVCLNGEEKPYREKIESWLASKSFQSVLLYSHKASVSAARNMLLEHFQEELLAFIDDDDVVSQNYLKNLRDVTDHNAMGISDIRSFKSSPDKSYIHPFSQVFKSISSEETSFLKARNFFSSPCGKMLSREMVGDIRFDETLKNGEDSLFMTMISNSIQKVKKAEEGTIYYIYERENSASRRKRGIRDRVQVCCYLYGKYIKLLGKKGYDTVFILSRFIVTMSTLIPEKSILRPSQWKKS